MHHTASSALMGGVVVGLRPDGAGEAGRRDGDYAVEKDLLQCSSRGARRPDVIPPAHTQR